MRNPNIQYRSIPIYYKCLECLDYYQITTKAKMYCTDKCRQRYYRKNLKDKGTGMGIFEY